MPKGLALLLFRGGPHDGQSFEFPSMRCHDRLSLRSDVYYASRIDGSVEIRHGIRLSTNWLSYCVHIYTKRGSDHSNIVYEYQSSDILHRCSAVTLKGCKCNNIALPDNNLCGIHAS